MPLRWIGLDFPFPLQGALPGLLHLLLPVLRFFFFFSSSSLSPSLQFDYYHIKLSHQPCFDLTITLVLLDTIPTRSRNININNNSNSNNRQSVSQAKHTASPCFAFTALRHTFNTPVLAHHITNCLLLPPSPTPEAVPSIGVDLSQRHCYTHPRYTQHHKPPAVLADPDQPTQDGFHGTIRLPRASSPRLPPVHARAASDALDVAVCPLGRLHQLPSS